MSAAKKSHAALLRPASSASASASASFSASASASATTAASPLLASGPRPPKAPPPRKAGQAAECERLEQLPNIGPSLAADLRDVGIIHPSDLVNQDAFALYGALCAVRGTRQDPCVLDTFMAAVDFMRGAPPQPWWAYTAQRKQRYGAV